VGSWLLGAAALVLIGSLFLTWSYQFPRAVLAIPGMRSALAGVPRDADAWQVYSVADVLLAALALTLLGVAVLGARRGRIGLVVATSAALAFVAHAAAVPPTSGVSLVVPGQGRLLRTLASPGAGETVAAVALGVALVGLLLELAAGGGRRADLSCNRADHAG
jgi:hypothetical protein